MFRSVTNEIKAKIQLNQIIKLVIENFASAVLWRSFLSTEKLTNCLVIL